MSTKIATMTVDRVDQADRGDQVDRIDHNDRIGHAGREGALAELVELTNAARGYAEAGRSDRTKKEYERDWSYFIGWCDQQGLSSLPALPATVALYVTAHAAKLRPDTLGRRAMVVRLVHNQAGLPDPTSDPMVQQVLSGIRRTHGRAHEKKAPIIVEDLKRVIGAIPSTLIGHRDRALLLLGFQTALRRSELVGLDVEDLEYTSQGIVVTIRRSKTDQEGEGRRVGVPYARTPGMCAVRAVKAWLHVAGIKTGPIFRPIDRHDNVRDRRLTDHSVAVLVKSRAEAAGLDPEKFAGHSLRSGFATSCAMVGMEERDIAKQTGHQSMRVLRGYIREGQLFLGNAVEKLDL